MREPKTIKQSIYFKHSECGTCHTTNVLTVGFYTVEGTNPARVCLECLELSIKLAKLLKRSGIK